ncbi:MAG TPA: hypothetical protein VJC17_03890 [Candidatus Dojkabacteria bacterium]|nr:hypothetical protein [Candidatus Dojkabacteria bacterium]
MEAKLENILGAISELRRKIDRLVSESDENRRRIDELKRMLEEGRYNDDMLRDLVRDIKELKTTANYTSINVKEIMNGMGVIYRSVDEIEENVVTERETK